MSSDLRCSPIALDQNTTMIVVVEMSQKNWLVSAMVPGLTRQPLKKIPAHKNDLFAAIERWKKEGEQAKSQIIRIVLAYEAGRDSFWLARWLRTKGIESHVIHAASVAVSRENKRAKTDRLDTKLLMRSFLGWLRGEMGHCCMAALPTVAEEDARRPNREHDRLINERTRLISRIKSAMTRFGITGFNPMLRNALHRLEQLRTAEEEPIPPWTLAEVCRDIQRLQLVKDQLKELDKQRQEALAMDNAHKKANPSMVKALCRIKGIGLDTSDLLSSEIFNRDLRNRRAVARYAGLTGSPDESGSRRREKGLARAGNARVRDGMIQLAWRFLWFHGDSALARWFKKRTENAPAHVRKTMIVALARKLLIALWRFVKDGVPLEGVLLKEVA